MSVKVGVITHIGTSDIDNKEDWHGRGIRRFDTASTRWTAAVAAFNTAAVDFSVILGGIVWEGVPGGTTDTEKLTLLQAQVDISETLDNDIYNIACARDEICFDGVGDAPAFSMWFSETGFVGGGHNQGTISNAYPDADNPYSYTFEVDGIRFVVVRTESDGGTGYEVSSDVLTWLSDTALDTYLPCVIFIGRYLHAEVGGTGDPPTSQYISNADTVMAAITAAGNVQAVIQGNTYYGTIAGETNVTGMFERFTVDNTPYYIVDSSVFAPEEADNRYYIFEIIPNAIQTANGMKANIKITGYGLANERSEDYSTYGIFQSA